MVIVTVAMKRDEVVGLMSIRLNLARSSSALRTGAAAERARATRAAFRSTRRIWAAQARGQTGKRAGIFRVAPVLRRASSLSPPSMAKPSQATGGGRFKSGPAELMLKFSESVSFDRRLAPFDVAGSKAHAAMQIGRASGRGRV